MKNWILALLFLFTPTYVFAAIVSERIEYKQGETILEGNFFYDDALKGKKPGIIVVHDWMGFGEYGDMRSEMLAELGYVALAVDIYGKGVRPQNNGEAAEQATIYKGNRALMRARVQAGLKALKEHPLVDSEKTAAIGYCFGGTVVLELARSGADTKGVVSFHGGLDTPRPEDAANIYAKVLVLHGAEDPYVPPAEVAAFQKEMAEGRVDWQMIYYSGAVHSFTKLASGADKSKGVAYNSRADQRSWVAMAVFFDEIFE